MSNFHNDLKVTNFTTIWFMGDLWTKNFSTLHKGFTSWLSKILQYRIEMEKGKKWNIRKVYRKPTHTLNHSMIELKNKAF